MLCFWKKNEKKLGLWIQRKREHIAVRDDYTFYGRQELSSRKIYGDRGGISTLERVFFDEEAEWEWTRKRARKEKKKAKESVGDEWWEDEDGNTHKGDHAAKTNTHHKRRGLQQVSQYNVIL